MSKKKKFKEKLAKGAKGFVLFEVPSGDPFFRIYGKNKNDFKDYKISNHDFYVKVRDASAVLENGALDIALGVKRAGKRSANGKTLMLHLLMGDGKPFARLYGPKKKDGSRRDSEDFVIRHPDMYVEITDKSAAFFESGEELWLDYSRKSMSTGVVMRKGKCIWASKEAIRKKWVSEQDLKDIKEANLSAKEKREIAESDWSNFP
jgi:hypothetical protein